MTLMPTGALIEHGLEQAVDRHLLEPGASVKSRHRLGRDRAVQSELDAADDFRRHVQRKTGEHAGVDLIAEITEPDGGKSPLALRGASTTKILNVFGLSHLFFFPAGQR